MARRLIVNVVVRDPRTHQVATFLAGDDVPDWAADLITTPGVWAADSGPDAGPDTAEPPRAGKGSSRAAWADHAVSLGLRVTAEMGRDDIIDLVDES